jgi:hypothetical protein
MSSSRFFILLVLAFVLTACGASRFYHANNNSYEDKTEPVKNVLFIIKDFATERKPYQRFEAYLQEELNKRGVDVRFFYVMSSDSLYEQKLKDSVLKYDFDFIIKENFQGFASSGPNIILQSNNSAPFATGPSMDANVSFMGYRKKVKYQLVWKSSCEGIQIGMFRSMYEVLGKCLINNLVAQKLIPAVPAKNE